MGKLKREDYPECEVEGCEVKAHHFSNGSYYCKFHYSRHNKGINLTKRRHFGKNEVSLEDGYYSMSIYNKDGEVAGYCYFDEEDYDLVKNYKWGYTRQKYIDTKIKIGDGKTRHILMHRLVMGLDGTSKPLIDHENLNKADNRKFNLRTADKSKNEMNKGLLSSNKSGVKGVFFRGKDNKWCSSIEFLGKKYINGHASFDEATKNRVIKESKYFKEYSYLYNKDTNTIQLSYHSHDDNLKTFIEVNLDGEVIKFDKQPNN